MLFFPSHFCMNNENCIHELTHIHDTRLSFGTSYVNGQMCGFCTCIVKKMSSAFCYSHLKFFFLLAWTNLISKISNDDDNDNSNNNERRTQSVRFSFVQNPNRFGSAEGPHFLVLLSVLQKFDISIILCINIDDGNDKKKLEKEKNISSAKNRIFVESSTF